MTTVGMGDYQYELIENWAGIGHLGDLNEMMILTPIAGAEMAMRDLNIPIELGSGVAAAQEYLCSTATQIIGS